jgi:hypothetical protein
MNQFYLIKGMKIKTIYIFIAALLLTGGAAAFLNQGANHAQQQTTGNPLIDAAQSGQDTSFRDQRLEEAQGVENIVNNVLNGDVQPLDGLHALNDIEFYAKSDINISPSDMQVNKNYVSFVIAAEDIVKAKLYKTGDEKAKLDIMKEKKAQI